MKLNWGIGIAIVIGLFMLFILYFVYKIQSDSKYDNELVVENYYQQEVHFQERLNKMDNAENMFKKVTLSQDSEHIQIVFPSDFEQEKIIGNISLYRPSNRKLDFEIPISLSSSNKLLIPKQNLAGGRWDIIIDWKHDTISYLNKFEISVN